MNFPAGKSPALVHGDAIRSSSHHDLEICAQMHRTLQQQRHRGALRTAANTDGVRAGAVPTRNSYIAYESRLRTRSACVLFSSYKYGGHVTCSPTECAVLISTLRTYKTRPVAIAKCEEYSVGNTYSIKILLRGNE